MKRSSLLAGMFLMIAGTVVILDTPAAQAGSFAQAVIAYDPGTTYATKWPNWDPYTNSSAAIGCPDAITEGFGSDNIVSPFNPAVKLNQIVSIGEGGQLTLQLANYLQVSGGPSLGIFSNAGVAEADYMNPIGTTGSPLTTFGVNHVNIDVSANGQQWVSLGDQLIDKPTNAYLDASNPYLASGAGLTSADFSKPFTATLNDLAGKTWPQILSIYNGSAGGTWLDLSATGLSQVGYIRFSVPDDNNTSTSNHFELDGVSIATGNIGAPVPEPATMLLLVLGLVGLRRRRS